MAASFCLLCWLFGHKWKLVTYNDSEWRRGIITRHCCRCGEPNPMFGTRPRKQSVEGILAKITAPAEEECDE